MNNFFTVIGEYIVAIPIPYLGVVGCIVLLSLLLGAVLLFRQYSLRLHVQVSSATVVEQKQQLELLCQHQRDELLQLNRRVETLQELQAELSIVSHERQRLAEAAVKNDTLLQTTQSALSEAKTQYAQLAARTEAEHAALNEKLALLQQSRQQLTGEFENLANRIFDEKNRTFSRSSQQLLDGTLAPLKQQLEQFRKKVDDAYNTESKERHLLKEQIVQLREESLRISEDANNLTRALKQDNKAQGNWGELTLIRALETCGLREPEEYQAQLVMSAEDGSKQIPDVVIHLPGGKDIIVDSKVSLLAYTRYFESEDEQLREQALKEHIGSVRTHVKQLSAKQYDKLTGVNTLDYVMLYIPVEGASTLALQHDRELWGDAYGKNIVLVSPTNLLAILRSVETIWRHERQNKNAERIASEAGRLHDHFVLFAKSLEETGKHLSKAQQSYDKTLERLVSGRGNLVKRVSRLQELGAKTSKTLSASLLADADVAETHWLAESEQPDDTEASDDSAEFAGGNEKASANDKQHEVLDDI